MNEYRRSRNFLPIKFVFKNFFPIKSFVYKNFFLLNFHIIYFSSLPTCTSALHVNNKLFHALIFITRMNDEKCKNSNKFHQAIPV